MREIDLDAADWSTPLDFYAALLPALGAPAWHSMSIAAIVDSMIGGEINAVEPPYVVSVYNLAGRPAAVVEAVEYAEGPVADAREYRLVCYDESVDAYFEIAGGERARRRASREVDPEAAAFRRSTAGCRRAPARRCGSTTGPAPASPRPRASPRSKARPQRRSRS